MSKEKHKKTNALRILDTHHIAYTISEYEWSEERGQGVHVADELGLDEKEVFKTLVGKGDKTGYVVFCIPVAEELDMKNHHGLFVCFNGSKVIDCQSHETLYNHAISVEDSKAILEHLKNFKARPMFDKDEYMYVNDVFDNTITYKGKPFNVMQYESRGNNYILCEKRDLAAFVDFEINKILTFGDPDYLQAHYKEMMEPFKDRLNCMFTSDFYFEFTAKGVDKAKTLDTVLIPMGYKKEEMMAFGDAQNDKSMVEYVGLGVAMGNASDELKAVANEITDTNNNDGIAKAIMKHIEL